MKLLTDEIKKLCAFLIKTVQPLETLKNLIQILTDRNIVMDAMNVHTMKPGEATIILHCRIERDRIRNVQNYLERIGGVIELELLEGKGPGMIKLE
jgi:hypothetical protein